MRTRSSSALAVGIGRIARFIRGVAIVTAIIWSSAANAGIITVNFPADIVGGDPCCTFHNATADGFRISPSCHFDEGVGNGRPGIGWDRSGCLSAGSGNPQYLGPPLPIPVGSGLYIDNNAHPFALLSLDSLGVSFFAESSKGGLISVPNTFGQPTEFDFAGPQWQGIEWVLFYYNDPGAPAAGFDQLVVRVPEPPTIAMFTIGILFFGWVGEIGWGGRGRRQRNSSRRESRMATG